MYDVAQVADSSSPDIWIRSQDCLRVLDVSQPEHAQNAVKRLRDIAAATHIASSAIESWIFVPSHGRWMSGSKQALIDWRKAVHDTTAFMRLLVVQQTEAQRYWSMLQAMPEAAHQITGLLVMPEQWEMPCAGHKATSASVSADEGGIGYTRRMIQEVSL